MFRNRVLFVVFALFLFWVGVRVHRATARPTKELSTKQMNDALFGVPRAAGTEMAPESTWNPKISRVIQKPGTRFVLDFATLTDNGTTSYKVVENDYMSPSEGVLFSEPYDAKSGNLGFGIVERTTDRKPFPCLMDVRARGKGTMRFFLQYGFGETSRICIFSTN